VIREASRHFQEACQHPLFSAPTQQALRQAQLRLPNHLKVIVTNRFEIDQLVVGFGQTPHGTDKLIKLHFRFVFCVPRQRGLDFQFSLGLRVHSPDMEHRWIALRLAFRFNFKVDTGPAVEAAKLGPCSWLQVEQFYFRTMRIDIGRSLGPDSRFSTSNFIWAKSLHFFFDFAKRYIGDRAKVIAFTLGDN